MSGWYELSNSTDGQFRFVLKAGNAETILTSELYKTRASAENGIASVQKNCTEDGRYERKEAPAPARCTPRRRAARRASSRSRATAPATSSRIRPAVELGLVFAPACLTRSVRQAGPVVLAVGRVTGRNVRPSLVADRTEGAIWGHVNNPEAPRESSLS